ASVAMECWPPPPNLPSAVAQSAATSRPSPALLRNRPRQSLHCSGSVEPASERARNSKCPASSSPRCPTCRSHQRQTCPSAPRELSRFAHETRSADAQPLSPQMLIVGKLVGKAALRGI